MIKRPRINFKRAVFWIASIVVALILILLFTAIFFPDIFLVIINILWIILFGVMIIFLVMGVLVLFGMKSQVKDLLTILLDGSLSIIEVLEFIDMVVRRFIKLIKDFLLFITPLFSFALATALYLFLLIIYKSGIRNKFNKFVSRGLKTVLHSQFKNGNLVVNNIFFV